MNRKKKTLYILGLTISISSIIGISTVIHLSKVEPISPESVVYDFDGSDFTAMYNAFSASIQEDLNNVIELVNSISGALFLFFCFSLAISQFIIYLGDRTNG